MKRLARLMLCASALSLVTAAVSYAQATEKTQFIDVSGVMPRDKPFFQKASSGEGWQATYKGKNVPSIVISILGIKSGDDTLLLLQTTLGSRDDVPLSRNLAVRLLELSGDWDHIKVVLYDDFLALRIDHPLKGVDAITVEALCDALATATDLATGEIKNFLP